ncbi:MAG: DNA polymerase III subunit beta [Candidatus Pacebacteria bacterium]|nr:DNA polymerase III subunit beta [Candidatus Paceibacterota bacterium]
MKFEILKDNFKKAAVVCERITRKTISLPVLQNVLLKTSGSFLEITTTNLEMSITWWVLAKINKQGSLLVPATFLANVLNLTISEKIEAQEENKNLILVSEGQEVQIQGQLPEEFPIIPKMEKEYIWQIDGVRIADGLAQVVEGATFSSIRPEISGVYFSFQKNKLKTVATDSFRLAEKTIFLEKQNEKDLSFIVPQQTCRELIAVLSQEKGNLEISANINQVSFDITGERPNEIKCRIQSRLIDGEYPKYQDILPKQRTARVQLNKEAFVNQLKKAGLFSGKVFDVKLGVLAKEGRLKFFSQNVDIGKNESFLPCKIEGQSQEVVFNYKFLLDGLNNIKGSEVFLELNGPDGPGVLRPVGDDTYFYILMPIKPH